jgi:hypothetical protein
MSNATPADDFEIPSFELPARVFETRDLQGTGPRGTVRDDRLVADRDNKMALKPRRKR